LHAGPLPSGRWKWTCSQGMPPTLKHECP